MMENVRQTEHLAKTYDPEASPANDNRARPLAMGRSSFPEGTVARIFKPSVARSRLPARPRRRIGG